MNELKEITNEIFDRNYFKVIKSRIDELKESLIALSKGNWELYENNKIGNAGARLFPLKAVHKVG